MPILADKRKCTGCASCYSKCAKSAISMLPDITGFLFPVVNLDLCVECGICTKACPVIDTVPVNDIISTSAFVIKHKDSRIRAESTSGGAFTAIAQGIINKGGIVFGAAFTSNMHVKHRYVEDEKDLELFRNSKYVQSEIGDTFKEAKQFLNDGRWVCFSGTPCQINGLLKYLSGTNVDKLITVDLVCHCVPSPLIFEKYIDYQRHKLGDFDKVVFRDKKRGYSYSTMAIYNDGICIYRNGSESDIWFRAFLHGFCDRESCGDCQFQQWPRKSDITIWDCFTARKYAPQMDDNNGATSVITWSEKGDAIIRESPNLCVVRVNPAIFRKKIDREHFSYLLSIDKVQMYLDAHSMNSEDFFNKYLPYTLIIKAKSLVRQTLYYSGLYNIAKRIIR